MYFETHFQQMPIVASRSQLTRGTRRLLMRRLRNVSRPIRMFHRYEVCDSFQS